MTQMKKTWRASPLSGLPVDLELAFCGQDCRYPACQSMLHYRSNSRSFVYLCYWDSPAWVRELRMGSAIITRGFANGLDGENQDAVVCER